MSAPAAAAVYPTLDRPSPPPPKAAVVVHRKLSSHTPLSKTRSADPIFKQTKRDMSAPAAAAVYPTLDRPSPPPPKAAVVVHRKLSSRKLSRKLSSRTPSNSPRSSQRPYRLDEHLLAPRPTNSPQIISGPSAISPYARAPTGSRMTPSVPRSSHTSKRATVFIAKSRTPATVRVTRPSPAKRSQAALRGAAHWANRISPSRKPPRMHADSAQGWSKWTLRQRQWLKKRHAKPNPIRVWRGGDETLL